MADEVGRTLDRIGAIDEAARGEVEARMLELEYWALETCEATAEAAAEARALEMVETLGNVRD